jgi:undecaprenyl-diphosphatase
MTPSLEALRAAPLHRVPRAHLTVAAIGIGLVAVTWLLLERATRRVPGWEATLFERINELPGVLRVPLWPVMQLGNFWTWIVAVPILIAVYRRPAPAVAVAISGMCAWVLAKVVKSFVERGRPAQLLDEVVVRESGIHGQGFVSGHAAVAAALAAAITPWLPRPVAVVAWVLVVLVAVARVYFGAHLPLDVIGGIGLGLVCGAIAGAIVGIPAVAR